MNYPLQKDVPKRIKIMNAFCINKREKFFWKKGHLGIIFLGRRGSGKSTIIGQLKLQTEYKEEERIKVLERYKDRYQSEEKLIFTRIASNYNDEIQEGRTKHLKPIMYSNENFPYDITFFDTPGDMKYITNIIAGVALSNIGIIVISVEEVNMEGELEENIELSSSVKEYGLICFTMRSKQIIVLINKMDVIDYCKREYDYIKEGVGRILRRLGYKDRHIRTIPVSGYTGVNITETTAHMEWHKGKSTLLEAIALLRPPKRRVFGHKLRIIAQNVYKISGIGTVICGRIISGILTANQNINFYTEGKTHKSVRFSGSEYKYWTGKWIENQKENKKVVRTIEMNCRELKYGLSNDFIGINIKGMSRLECKLRNATSYYSNRSRCSGRGLVISGEFPIFPVSWVEANIQIMRQHISSSSNVIVCAHVNKCECTLLHKGRENRVYQKGEIVLVQLIPKYNSLIVEKYKDSPAMGSLILLNNNKIIAIGIVKDLKRISFK